MTKVVEFRAASRPRIVSNSGATAEVVLFPGVRYERWADEPADKRGRRARNRDTLELVE